jgi:hypothetical protein
MARHIDGQDVLAQQSLEKLRAFAQLLARQAAREALNRAPVPEFSVFGDPNSFVASVVLGTATCA